MQRKKPSLPPQNPVAPPSTVSWAIETLKFEMTTADDNYTTANSDPPKQDPVVDFFFLEDRNRSLKILIPIWQKDPSRGSEENCPSPRKDNPHQERNQKLWLKLWGRESIKVSDCLPYLKCFNVEDIVNIRGHFSSQKYLRDTTVTSNR